MKPGLVPAAILLGWAACSFTLGDDLLEERTETFQLEQGATLSIRNINGSVTIEPWDGQLVEATLVIRGNAATGIPDGFSARASSTPSSLVYNVEYPRGSNAMSVNFTIRVPRELSLSTDVEIANGNITVSGPHSVNLETVNGNISIEGAMGGEGAEGANGNITASFAALSNGSSLETVNGSISALLPRDAAFSAETVNGTVTVDGFETTSSSRTSAVVRGEPSTEMETVNGNITVGVI